MKLKHKIKINESNQLLLSLPTDNRFPTLAHAPLPYRLPPPQQMETEKHLHSLAKVTVVNDQALLDKKIFVIHKAGPSKLQVIADFDATLTKYCINGCRGQSGGKHTFLVEGGLTYDAIKSSVANALIDFRDGVVQLFEFLEERNIPVLIFMAGLANIIEEVLRQKLHRSFKNVEVLQPNGI